MKVALKTWLIIGSCLGCNEIDDLKDNFEEFKAEQLGESLYVPTPGDPLEDHLFQLIGSSNSSFADTLALIKIAPKNEAMGLSLSDSGSPPEVTDGMLKTYESFSSAKKSIKIDEFLTIEESYFNQPIGEEATSLKLAESNTISWTHSSDEYVVPDLGKQPVRNQGVRSTCSAFTGIGQIEGALIRKYGIDGIDLSEQRFYFMSKPQHWSDGGAVSAGGSNAGTGFAKSAGFEHEGKTFPPESPNDFNLPLEVNCPYVEDLGSNDLQSPQAEGCKTGVAKVVEFTAWLKDHKKRLSTAQEIYDALISWQYPIIVGTKLSENWEKNDGMITLAASGGAGATTHATGHAYLIVGARKISEEEYPNEGGMCFIIKNSWGPGWGVNGYSCMTLAWFNTWKYQSFPQVLDVTLDPTAYEEAKKVQNQPPAATSGLEENSGEVVTKTTNSADSAVKKVVKGRVTFLAGNETKALSWEKLGKFYQMVYEQAEDGSKISFSGVLKDKQSFTKWTTLSLDSEKVMFQQDGFPSYQVGTWSVSDEKLILCSNEFSDVCELKYDQSGNELRIGLTEAQSLKEPSTGPYEWKEVGFGGYSVDFS